MTRKVTTLDQAIDLLPDEGFTLAFGGVTMYRRPMAFSLGMINRFRERGAPSGITLICFTAGLESDLLVGEEMVDRVRTCYFGLEAFGLAPHFTAKAGNDEIEIVEESEASLASGLRAKLAGLGFMPSQAWLGTDMPKLRPDVKTVRDPYTGAELIAFPAIDIDVAVIHALQADEDGNALIGGNKGVDVELALTAGTVIITAEKILPALNKADIVSPVVDAVVPALSGAWPTSCHPDYPLDGLAVLAYLEAVGTAQYSQLVGAWLRRHGIKPDS